MFPATESRYIPLKRSGELNQKRSILSLNLFTKRAWIVIIIAASLQCIFFFSLENLFAISCTLVAWKLMDVFIFRPYILARFSLSAVVLLGFSITQYCLPLIFTLVEGKPLVYNLDLPYEVFTHSFLALITLLIAHLIYRNLQKGRNIFRFKIQSILGKTSFFVPPSNMQIWIMGFIGSAGMILTYFTGNRYNVTDEERGGLAKILQALIPFAYAPYFILLRKLYDPKSKKVKQPVFRIIIYSILILIVGIGGNSRASFMTGITAAGIAYFLGLLLGKFNYRIFTIKNTILLALGFWIITGPLSDLGTAMLMVRGQRTDISSTELISKTLNAYTDKKALRIYKQTAVENISDWNENYFDNIFLARFCNLKFNDGGLKQYEKIGHIDPKMQKYSIDKFWAALPLPLLSFFNVSIDKKTVISASFGDYLFSRAGGANALGGFRTGQFASTGMAAFGWCYLLLLGVGIIPLFFLLDLFVIFKKNYQQKKYITYVSLAGLIPITSFFMFLSLSSTSESVVNIYTYLLRGWIQLVFLYWLVYYVSRKIALLAKQ
jgi:hypothetical protein